LADHQAVSEEEEETHYNHPTILTMWYHKIFAKRPEVKILQTPTDRCWIQSKSREQREQRAEQREESIY